MTRQPHAPSPSDTSTGPASISRLLFTLNFRHTLVYSSLMPRPTSRASRSSPLRHMNNILPIRNLLPIHKIPLPPTRPSRRSQSSRTRSIPKSPSQLRRMTARRSIIHPSNIHSTKTSKSPSSKGSAHLVYLLDSLGGGATTAVETEGIEGPTVPKPAMLKSKDSP